MIQVDKNIWSINDPDKVLSFDASDFDQSVLKFGGAIHPREDLLSFEHNSLNYLIDFGFYGSEITLDGSWVVYVIDTNHDEPWGEPVERIQSDRFLEGISYVQSMLTKYT